MKFNNVLGNEPEKRLKYKNGYHPVIQWLYNIPRIRLHTQKLPYICRSTLSILICRYSLCHFSLKSVLQNGRNIRRDYSATR